MRKGLAFFRGSGAGVCYVSFHLLDEKKAFGFNICPVMGYGLTRVVQDSQKVLEEWVQG